LTDLIQLEVGTRAERVAVLTLRDSDRRNAITPAMNDGLVAALDDVEADPDVGAVVITGHGSSFCAGADLKHLGASPSELGLRDIYRGFLRVAQSPLPTIAAVNGPAVGAGMNLALCCDVRLAAHSAFFDTRFLKLGIHPGGGHTWMMRRAVGAQATLAAVLFGETLDGHEAEQSGLVWRCVPDESLLSLSVAMAQRAASAPPELARRLKRTIADMASVDNHDRAVTEELAAQLWSMAQPEFADNLASLQREISNPR
jgi:enoyl-CoA hydratase